MIKRSSFVILMAAMFAAGCTDDSNIPPPVPPADENTPPPPATYALQVIHASKNTPTVDVTVGGADAQSNVDFKTPTTARSFLPGTGVEVVVTVDRPEGATGDAPSLSLTGDFAADNFYAVFALGNLGDTGATALQASRVFTRSGTIPANDVVATLLHAAAGAPPVNIYVTADGATRGAPVNGTTPVAFGDDLVLSAIPAGDYRIEVEVAADDTPVFDSGVVTLMGGIDPIIAAVDNTNAGSDAPISVLVVGRLQVLAEIQDVDSEAEVRVIHTISDLSGAVDIVVSENTAAEGEDPVWEVVTDGGVDGLVFKDVAPDQVPGGNGLRAEPDTYRIQVFEAGSTTNCLINCDDAEADPPEEPSATTLNAGIFYDAIARGVVTIEEGETEPDPAPALVYEGSDSVVSGRRVNDRRRLALTSKLRLIHSAGNVGEVDIYVEASDATAPSGDPDVDDAAFGANTGFLSLLPGSYKVFITPGGEDTSSTTPVLTVETGELVAEGVYTAIVVDGPDANTVADTILLDDFTAPATP